MLEAVKYINHIQETLFLDTPKLFISTSDLHDFTWNVQSKNGRISGFKKGVFNKSISITIKGNTAEECKELANRLFDVMEKDTLTKQYGKLFVGDYYLKCYTSGSKKEQYIRKQGLLKITLKVATDAEFWMKESKTTFGYNVTAPGKGLDYKTDFPYDYTSSILETRLNNQNFVDSNFLMYIYGVCDNPIITIGGHIYEVAVSVGKNEYLILDSLNKKITLVHENGLKENCFHFRNRESYIFEKIPPGTLKVSSNTEFKFDIVLFEERSEPKWI